MARKKVKTMTSKSTKKKAPNAKAKAKAKTPNKVGKKTTKKVATKPKISLPKAARGRSLDSPGKSIALLKRQVQNVIEGLDTEYPEAECALDHDGPAQLLFATILSAQCTDVMVNKVTKDLFRIWPRPDDLAKAKVSEIEKVIKRTGFYKNKAKNLKACAQALVEKHSGKVPKDLDELTNLAGVGRKTANVVRGNAFGIPGMVVDTHVKRITNLIGLTVESDPVKIEHELMKIVPEEHWTMFSHWIIHHGRAICIARRPKCGDCVIRAHCDFGKKQPLSEL